MIYLIEKKYSKIKWLDRNLNPSMRNEISYPNEIYMLPINIDGYDNIILLKLNDFIFLQINIHTGNFKYYIYAKNKINAENRYIVLKNRYNIRIIDFLKMNLNNFKNFYTDALLVSDNSTYKYLELIIEYESNILENNDILVIFNESNQLRNNLINYMISRNGNLYISPYSSEEKILWNSSE